VVSPWARENYVGSSLLDQTSILRFIQDNWLAGARISDASFDTIAGSIEDLFDFSQPVPGQLFLDPLSGEIVQVR